MGSADAADRLLASLGMRVKALRREQGLTAKELAARTGLSPRFLVDVEGGRGNLSVRRLAALAAGLGTSPAALLEAPEAAPATASEIVALLGVRGAGKSTVGRELARRLGVGFVELDHEVERTAGLDLAEIFSIHGAGYYRKAEAAALRSVLDGGDPCVLATGGSLVTHEETFAALRERATTVWLRAEARDHWERVVAQGDTRPMGENPHAFRELEELLREREGVYRRADVVVETSGRGVEEVVGRVEEAIRTRAGAGGGRGRRRAGIRDGRA